MNARKVLSALAVVGLLVGLVALTATVDAAPNNNVPVAPALPANVTAAPTGASLLTPWNCFAGDMAGSLCNLNTEMVLTVGFRNPNTGRAIGQVYQIKLASDGNTVTATDITNGGNTVIAWTPPANSATKYANALDFLNTVVSRLKAAGAFVVQPSL